MSRVNRLKWCAAAAVASLAGCATLYSPSVGGDCGERRGRGAAGGGYWGRPPGTGPGLGDPGGGGRPSRRGAPRAGRRGEGGGGTGGGGARARRGRGEGGGGLRGGGGAGVDRAPVVACRRGRRRPLRLPDGRPPPVRRLGPGSLVVHCS